MVDAELKRRDEAEALQPWRLVTDAESPTGLSDPVVDQGARDALAALLAALGDKLAEGGTVALDAATLAALEAITVSGPLTDTELRAAPVEVDIASTSNGPVPVEVTNGSLTIAEPVTVDGEVALDAATLAALETVNVANLQTDALTDTELRSSPVPVSATDLDIRNLTSTSDSVRSADDYQGGECLADQTGAGGVLTFTFSAPVQLVVVDADGSESQVARADPFGGTPTASQGVPCRDEAAAYMPVETSEVKVFTPAGMVVSVCGYRRS